MRVQRAGHGVEAGGEDDGVERVVLAARDQPVARDVLDRRLAQVDQRDVRPVEGLVVAGVDAQPLAADHGASGDSASATSGSFTISRILRAHELGGGLVGSLVDQQVVEGAE